MRLLSLTKSSLRSPTPTDISLQRVQYRALFSKLPHVVEDTFSTTCQSLFMLGIIWEYPLGLAFFWCEESYWQVKEHMMRGIPRVVVEERPVLACSKETAHRVWLVGLGAGGNEMCSLWWSLCGEICCWGFGRLWLWAKSRASNCRHCKVRETLEMLLGRSRPRVHPKVVISWGARQWRRRTEPLAVFPCTERCVTILLKAIAYIEIQCPFCVPSARADTFVR